MIQNLEIEDLCLNATNRGSRVFIERTCTFDGCDEPLRARGWCYGHYRQYRSGEDAHPLAVRDAPCSFAGCRWPSDTGGLCLSHRRQQGLGQELRPLRGYTSKHAIGERCEFEGCDNLRARRMWCKSHYQQQRVGQVLRPLRRVPEGSCAFESCDRLAATTQGWCRSHYRQWQKTGSLAAIGRRQGFSRKPRLTHDGYVLVYDPDHPNSRLSGRLLEHTKVMTEMLGRALLLGENVHHVNGVKDDNRPENLELWVTSQPSGQRPEDLVAWAHEILERYETTKIVT